MHKQPTHPTVGRPKKGGFDECLHSLYRQRPLHLPASQGWLFLLHRDNDFYTVYKRVPLHPFFTPQPTPRVQAWSSSPAGWCMQLSNSTASGRGATNTASPCHSLCTRFSAPPPIPPACPLSSLPSSCFFPPHTRLLMYTNSNHNNNGYRQ